MRSKGMFKGSARGVCALLGAAGMFALPGCDMADGVVALVSNRRRAIQTRRHWFRTLSQGSWATSYQMVSSCRFRLPRCSSRTKENHRDPFSHLRGKRSSLG
jgi:hypothetical protein